MLIRLVWVGRTRDPGLAAWVETYRTRIAPHCPIEIVETKDAAGKGAARASREGRGLARELSGRGLVVALDETGRTMNSARFASWLGKALETRREVTFLLGGSEGLDPAVRAAAEETLSLSPLTFTHELARVLLLEQIVRAFSVLKGTPYHR